MESKVLYDTFNARYLSFKEVADSFIKNDYFEKLTRNSHSLLMGPRGCGKTTLLKMLTPPALIFWDVKQKTDLFKEIPFIGIYVPTDIQWKRQLEKLGEDSKNISFSAIVSRGTVTINILISLIKTFSFLKEIFENERKENLINKETELCKKLIDKWKLRKPIIPTFDSIEIELFTAIGQINAEIRKCQIIKDYDPKLEELFYFDFIDLVKIGCTLFEKTFEFENKRKWALCFDELEIAPEWLQQELLTYLRSRDQTIIFKLTTAPIISLIKEIKNGSNLIEATENNDFNAIKIWTSDQKEFKVWRDFSNQLVRSKISRRIGQSIDPQEIFGNSFLERLIDETLASKVVFNWKMDFERDSPSWVIVKELAKVDRTFYDFLVSKNISPIDPSPSNLKQKDEIFRKIKQLVIYRYQFKKSGNSRRSRKVIPLYYGIHLLYDLCDGNPRVLIGMIDELLDLAIIKQNTFRQLSINEQSRVVMEISNKYIKTISSHPEANVVIRDRIVNISDVLELIGQNFHNRIVNEPFSMDPPGSFYVDEDLNNKYVELLELALYLGAIVFIESDNIISDTGLINKKFRLSYTLSPYFGLLSREFKDIKLSSIISRGDKSVQQSTLFKKNENKKDNSN